MYATAPGNETFMQIFIFLRRVEIYKVSKKPYRSAVRPAIKTLSVCRCYPIN